MSQRWCWSVGTASARTFISKILRQDGPSSKAVSGFHTPRAACNMWPVRAKGLNSMQTRTWPWMQSITSHGIAADAQGPPPQENRRGLACTCHPWHSRPRQHHPRAQARISARCLPLARQGHCLAMGDHSPHINVCWPVPVDHWPMGLLGLPVSANAW